MSPDLLYGLVLLAAVAHATWNALIKSASDRVLMMAAIRLVGMLLALAVLPFVPWPSHATWIWLALASITTFAIMACCSNLTELAISALSIRSRAGRHRFFWRSSPLSQSTSDSHRRKSPP